MANKYLTSPVASTSLPSGIPYIVCNEAAERFSFYGMKAILVVYMTKYLMSLDGDKDVMTDDQAKTYYHLFTSSAYFFPIFGSILADWLLGKYRTIIALSLVYCLGHVALAVGDTSLANWFSIEPRVWMFTGLTLIAIGSGGIKPCVSAHVGDQFGKKNEHLISRVFAWFYFSINLGAFLSTLLTPLLLDRVGPSVAFGLPGVLMFLATFVFWLGRRKFIHVPAGGIGFFKESFSSDGIRALLNLSVLYLFIAVFWSLFDQTGSAWVLQAQRMNRNLFGIDVLPSQIQAANPVLVLVLIPFFSYAVYPWVNRFVELTPLRKIAIGFFVTVAAFAIPAWVEMQIDGGSVFKTTSDHESSEWSSEYLLDGQSNGDGWVSAYKPKTPPEIVVRLRQRRAWPISSVEINPATRFSRTKNGKDGTEQGNNCWSKQFELLVGDTPKGPWKSVGEYTLEKRDSLQPIQFTETSTEFVMIRLKSNWGGDFFTLGEIQILSTDPLAAKAPTRGNVAAIGFRPHIIWQLVAYVLLTAAEVMVSITALEFSYTQAPKKMKSFIMAVFLASVSLGNAFTSLVNYINGNEDGTSKYEGASYYWFFTIVMAVTSILFLFVMKFYRGETYIQGEK